MDAGLMMMLSVAVLSGLVFLVWSIVWRVQTRRLLRLHTEEWRRRMDDAICNGRDVDEEYLQYIQELRIMGGIFGACFPPRYYKD